MRFWVDKGFKIKERLPNIGNFCKVGRKGDTQDGKQAHFWGLRSRRGGGNNGFGLQILTKGTLERAVSLVWF